MQWRYSPRIPLVSHTYNLIQLVPPVTCPCSLGELWYTWIWLRWKIADYQLSNISWDVKIFQQYHHHERVVKFTNCQGSWQKYKHVECVVNADQLPGQPQQSINKVRGPCMHGTRAQRVNVYVRASDLKGLLCTLGYQHLQGWVVHKTKIRMDK